ncbi:retrovirus-related pol polyprotein from transposon TNT 1-94 [Tanacetum coccineum]
MSLSLAENVIVVGADNRHPMLDKTNYSSWASRMLLYIKGKPNGKLLVDSVLIGPFRYGTIVEPRTETTPATVRARTYTDLTDEEKLRESVDITPTNIVLQGLPQDIYNLVNHNEDAKQIWDRVKLLIQGSELSLQERESKMQHEAHANEVRLERQRYPDQIALVANSPSCLNPTQYYPQLSSVSQQYYPSPAPQRSYDAPIVQQSHYLPQVVTPSPAVHQQQYQAPIVQQSYQAPAIQQSSSPELDSGLVVPYSNPFDDPIANLNKLMAFVSISFGPFQGKQTQGYANNRARNTATNPGVNRQGAPIQARVVKCYNYQEEGHFARQCTKPKRPKNSAWFKEKMLLTEALESGAYLNPEQLAFLADNGDTIIPAQASQEILTPAAFQTDDLDAFDSDCDDAPSAKAILTANLSSYDSDVLSVVPFHDTNIENAISYQSVQETQCSEQPSLVNDTEVDITNTLLMSVIEEMSSQVAKCNKVQQENIVVNETLTVELERYKEQATLFEQRQKFDLNDREKYIDGQLRQVIVERNAKVADFEKQIHSLKLQLNATVESHKILSKTVECLKRESKQKEDKYLDKVIDLQKKNKALENVVYKMGQSTQTMHMLTKPQAFYNETHKTAHGYQKTFYLSQARRKVFALYDGNTIVKTYVTLSVTDSEETLELAEKSRLKMLAKQNDPSLKEKRVNIALVDYVALNKLSEHFVKHFVPRKQLSTEQAYWLPISKPVSEKPPVPSEPVLKKEILVNFHQSVW